MRNKNMQVGNQRLAKDPIGELILNNDTSVKGISFIS